MKIQVIKKNIKNTIFIGVVVGMLIAVGFLLLYSLNTMREYASANHAKADIQQVIQEAGTYDALQSRETKYYLMFVLDNAGEKDIRYYDKNLHLYHFYRVKPDLSVEEVPFTEIDSLPANIKLEE